MKAVENAKYVTYRNLIEYVKKNKERAQKVPAFFRFIQDLEDYLNQVETAESQAQQSTEGVTLEKNNFKSTLQGDIVRLGKTMIAYAEDNKDVVLQSKVKSLNTKLTKARQAEFPIQCSAVLAEARLINGGLADYGITQDTLSDLEARIAMIKAKTTATKGAMTDKKSGAQSRTDIFSSIGSVMNKKIKNVATAFVGVDDDLFNGIVNCMKVPKPPSTTTQIKVVFKYSETQKAAMKQSAKLSKKKPEKQSARIVETDKTKKVNKKGEIVFKLTKTGIYTIEVPLPNGEMRIIENLEANRGKTVLVEIVI